MSMHITTSILKSYGPGLRVRDDSGNAKVVYFGGTKRVRIPSASIKYVVRRLMGGDEIRSAFLGRFISSYVYSSKDIPEEEKKSYATLICKAIGCNFVDPTAEENNKKEKKKKKKSENENEADNTEQEDEASEKKGNKVIVMEAHALEQVCNGLISYIKDQKEKLSDLENKLKTDENLNNDEKNSLNNEVDKLKRTLSENSKELFEEANKIYEKNPRAINEALFGIMSTGGVTKTMYGAVKMSHMYSIDRYAGDRDFWIATHQSNPITYSEDALESQKDFFDALNTFTSEERAKANAETLDETDIYANTMYGNMTVDLRCLFENLNERVTSESDKLKNIPVAAETTADVVKNYIIANPEAKQTSHASYPAPDITYIEIVKDGNTCTPEFSEAIRPGLKSVVEQGIDKILSFANDTTFRTGKIKRYVLLPANRDEYCEEFKKIGVTVVEDLNQLRSIIMEETTNILTNL